MFTANIFPLAYDIKLILNWKSETFPLQKPQQRNIRLELTFIIISGLVFIVWNNVHYIIFLFYCNICSKYNPGIRFKHLLTTLIFEIGLRQVQSSLNFGNKSETESSFNFSANTNSVWAWIYSQIETELSEQSWH